MSLMKCIGKYNPNSLECQTCLFKSECIEYKKKKKIRERKRTEVRVKVWKPIRKK